MTAPAAIVALLWLATPSPGRADSGSPRAAMREALEAFAASPAARWSMDSWERLGDRTEETRSRCAFSEDRGLLLEVERGRGSGAAMHVLGSRVRVRLPGLLRGARATFSVGDAKVRSLRGNTLASAGLRARAQEVAGWLGESEVAAVEGGLVAERREGGRLVARATLSGSASRPSLTVEGFEHGEVVERVGYSEIELNASLEGEDWSP